MKSQESNQDARRLVYTLMYNAFIEMRFVASEGRGHKGIFKIADLFHTIPLKLERLEREGGGYQELLTKIQEHADRNGSRVWLDGVIERIERSNQAS